MKGWGRDATEVCPVSSKFRLTRTEAGRAAKRKDLRIYRCQECRGYHTGSRKPHPRAPVRKSRTEE